jgi:5-methylcytosine-specific restriction endonuclease McrA
MHGHSTPGTSGGLLTVSHSAFRPMRRQRRCHLSPGFRQSFIERDGLLCAYCGYEADQVDHIIPWSYGGTSDPENLVACCGICNNIAYNKVFNTFEAKREHVRSRYGPYLEGRVRQIRRQLSICGDCGNVFIPRVRGASAVLCGPCYRADEEWGL